MAENYSGGGSETSGDSLEAATGYRIVVHADPNSEAAASRAGQLVHRPGHGWAIPEVVFVPDKVLPDQPPVADAGI